MSAVVLQIDAYCDCGFKVGPAVKAEMQRQGKMMIQYQPQGDYVNFFRMVTSNPTSTKQDMDYAINLIAESGEKLFPCQ